MCKKMIVLFFLFVAIFILQGCCSSPCDILFFRSPDKKQTLNKKYNVKKLLETKSQSLKKKSQKHNNSSQD